MARPSPWNMPRRTMGSPHVGQDAGQRWKTRSIHVPQRIHLRSLRWGAFAVEAAAVMMSARPLAPGPNTPCGTSGHASVSFLFAPP